jgi:hypothetical protein
MVTTRQLVTMAQTIVPLIHVPDVRATIDATEQKRTRAMCSDLNRLSADSEL